MKNKNCLQPQIEHKAHAPLWYLLRCGGALTLLLALTGCGGIPPLPTINGKPAETQFNKFVSPVLPSEYLEDEESTDELVEDTCGKRDIVIGGRFVCYSGMTEHNRESSDYQFGHITLEKLIDDKITDYDNCSYYGKETDLEITGQYGEIGSVQRIDEKNLSLVFAPEGKEYASVRNRDTGSYEILINVPQMTLEDGSRATDPNFFKRQFRVTLHNGVVAYDIEYTDGTKAGIRFSKSSGRDPSKDTTRACLPLGSYYVEEYSY